MYAASNGLHQQKAVTFALPPMQAAKMTHTATDPISPAEIQYQYQFYSLPYSVLRRWPISEALLYGNQ